MNNPGGVRGGRHGGPRPTGSPGEHQHHSADGRGAELDAHHDAERPAGGVVERRAEDQ
jgi:hypothetical protein